MCVCFMCVGVVLVWRSLSLTLSLSLTHTHTHTANPHPHTPPPPPPSHARTGGSSSSSSAAEFRDIPLAGSSTATATGAELTTPRSRLNPSTPNSSRGAPPPQAATVAVGGVAAEKDEVVFGR